AASVALAVPAARAERVAAVSRLDHVVVEPVEVVGAHQLPARAAVEGDVQQRLVALALAELMAIAPGPDGFADAERRPLPAVLVDELPPHGDDARGVASHRVH